MPAAWSVAISLAQRAPAASDGAHWNGGGGHWAGGARNGNWRGPGAVGLGVGIGLGLGSLYAYADDPYANGYCAYPYYNGYAYACGGPNYYGW